MQGIPDKIGAFEVLRQIGAGGMGAVYLGRDAELNRQVAIKVILQVVHDQEVLDRFFREARAAAALRHPNIITIYSAGQHEHRPYMVLEFVDGESLADIIKERRPLPLSEKLSYIDQVCAGLHFAHRAGIVHRDIKPANVMVDRDGVVRVLDFGIARIEGSAMTQDGTLIGSLNYMSPEQMLGRAVDHRSDIFSVGSLAYELLTYQQAFKGSLNDGLFNRLPNEDPPLPSQVNPEIPAEVEQVVMRALKKAPEDRFQNLADMRQALGVAQAGSLGSVEERTIAIRRENVPGASTSLDFLFEEAPEAFRGVTSLDFRMGENADALRASTSHIYSSAPEAARDAAPASDPQMPHSQVFEAPAAEAPGVESKPPAAPPGPPSAVTPPSPTVMKTKAPETVNKPPATVIKSPTVVSKPAGTTISRPPAAPARPYTPPPPESSSKKWIVIAAAVVAVAIGGAVVVMPMLTEQPDPIAREQPRVVETMERFRSAYRNRNVDGVLAVFPSLPRDLRTNMERAFDRCLVYEVTFGNMQVKLNPDATEAQVDLRSSHQCTPNSNDPQTTTSEQDVFTLQRQGETWQIASQTAQ